MSSQQATTSADRQQAIAEAARAIDLSALPAWGELASLSTHTTLDGLEVDPEGVIIKGNDFEGSMVVYVKLDYGSSEDRLETSDAFNASFTGHFGEGDRPIIDRVEVDTSPFYA